MKQNQAPVKFIKKRTSWERGREASSLQADYKKPFKQRSNEQQVKTN